MSLSFEKFQSGRSGALGAAWESSTSGGVWSGLLNEWSRVSVALRVVLNTESSNPAIELLKNPTMPLDTSGVERRLSFLGWDFDSRLKTRGTFSVRDFADVYFNDLGFRPALEVSDPDLILLDSVLAKREGSVTTLAALFSWGADRASEKWQEFLPNSRLRLDLIHDAPSDVIRVTQEDRTVEYISMKSKGQSVQSDDWIAWCAAHPSLQRLTLPEIWIRLLSEMKSSLDNPSTRWSSSAALAAQSLILDQMIAFKPSHIRWLAERAVIRHRRGDNAGALDDLKRFFAFQDREAAPPSLVSLYEQLL